MVALLALAEQAVRLIDADAEARPAHVMIDDVGELRQNLNQCRAIASQLDVAVERVEEPQRGVGGVIKPLVLSFRKHVRNESVTDVMSKGSENPTGFGEAAGRKRQPF